MKTDVKISSTYNLMFCIEINARVHVKNKLYTITLMLLVRCKLGLHCLSHFCAYQEVHGYFLLLALFHTIHVYGDLYWSYTF